MRDGCRAERNRSRRRHERSDPSQGGRPGNGMLETRKGPAESEPTRRGTGNSRQSFMRYFSGP